MPMPMMLAILALRVPPRTPRHGSAEHGAGPIGLPVMSPSALYPVRWPDYCGDAKRATARLRWRDGSGKEDARVRCS
jgi:hypothetical protein